VRQLWNEVERPQPAVICLTVQDVIHFWLTGQGHMGCPSPVQAGGHDPAGQALSEGVVIDFSDQEPSPR